MDKHENTTKMNTPRAEVRKPEEIELTPEVIAAALALEEISRGRKDFWSNVTEFTDAMKVVYATRLGGESIQLAMTRILARAYRKRDADVRAYITESQTWRKVAIDANEREEALRAELKTASDALRVAGEREHAYRASIQAIHATTRSRGVRTEDALGRIHRMTHAALGTEARHG